MKTNLLFICTSNLDRSPRAEALFKDNPNYKAKSAGFFPVEQGTEVSKELINWADKIFVMETTHKDNLLEKFREVVGDKEIIVLGINNDFCFGDEELGRVLRRGLEGEGVL